MTRQTIELRSWTLIAISFTLGMLAADFVNYQWQSHEDASHAVVASDSIEP